MATYNDPYEQEMADLGTGDLGNFGFSTSGAGNSSDGTPEVYGSQVTSGPPGSGVTFRGLGPAGSGVTLKTGPGGKIRGVVDTRKNRQTGYESPTYGQVFPDRVYRGGINDFGQTMPTVSEQLAQRAQDIFNNPRNRPDLPGYSYDARTSAPGEPLPRSLKMLPDGMTALGPTESVYREQSPQEMVARALGAIALNPFGMALSAMDTKENYLSSEVTPEMRARGPQSLFTKGISALTGGVDPQQALDAAGRGLSSLRDRMTSLMPGGAPTSPDATPTTAPRFDPREMDAMAQPAMRAVPQDVGAPELGTVAYSGPTYDTVTPQTKDIATPIAMPEEVRTMRETFNDLDVFGPDMYEGAPVTIAEPRARPDRNAPNVGMRPATEDLDFVQFPELSNAPNVGMSPAKPEDTFTVQDIFPELRNAPNAGYERDFGPRTADDLRSMGIEPTLQDLMNMEVSPAEFLREQSRMQPAPATPPSVASTGDLREYAEAMNAAGMPMVAANTSLENFMNNNPQIGEALMASREGAQLNDIMRFGGLDKSQPIETFVDPETAEIKVQGYDRRGRSKGFNIDASDFFGKFDIGEFVSEALQKGGMSIVPDESLRERSMRENREFLEGLEESERRAAQQGGIFSNIQYRS